MLNRVYRVNWLKQTFVWMVSQSNHQKQDWLPCLLSIRCQFWIWYWGLVSKSKWVFSYLKRTLTSMSNPFRKQGLSKFSSSSIIRRWQEQCNLSMMQFCIQSCIELFWNSLLVNLFIFCLTPCTIFHQLFSWELINLVWDHSVKWILQNTIHINICDM